MKIIGPLLLSALATLGACSDAAGPTGSDERSDEIDPSEVPLLAEQYGAVISSTMNLCQTQTSPCPEAELIKVTGTLRGILKTTQDGPRVQGELSACEVKLTWNDDDYDSADYLNIAKLGTLLRFDAAFAATENGPVLGSDMAALVLGAELSDDVGEDFPTDEDDARTYDQDNDGKPGISVKAPIGKIFLGARVVVDFNLTLDAEGALLGELRGHDFDVSVFDDSIPFINAEKKVRNALDPVALIDQGHGIELFPNTADCAAAAQL